MGAEYALRYAKHLAKQALGRPDPVWPFFNFEHHIHPETLRRHDEILATTEASLAHALEIETAAAYQASTDPIVRQGYELQQVLYKKFKNLHAATVGLRILIQIPDPLVSPGVYSFLSNFADAFEYLGIPVLRLMWSDDTKQALETFAPTIMLVTDHALYLDKIDWPAVAMYRASHTLHLGLLAHLEEYGNTPLLGRLAWAKQHAVDFYFSVRDKAYTHSRKEYQPFFEHGYQILTIPFGANPLHYYPVPGITRDLNYSFIASTNWTKGPTYAALAQDVVSQYPGFIYGGGWRHVKKFVFNRDRDRYVYARSRVALNFHVPEQIAWACEVNERTHQLAMCGVPQLLDKPKLLPELYSADALFACENAQEFSGHFKEILANPAYGEERALKAQKEVFEKHTTFHRVDDFVTQLQALLSTHPTHD